MQRYIPIRKKRLHSRGRKKRSSIGYIQLGTSCTPFLPEVCDPQACIHFGYWDRLEHKIDRENWETMACIKGLERFDFEPDSLGNPVGMICSKVQVKPIGDKKNVDSLRFATYLKAFALIYILPEVEWTPENIDNLLEEGKALFCESKLDTETSKSGTTVYSDNELFIKRKFTIQGYCFTLELEPRFIGDTMQPIEMQPEHIIANLRKVLKSFFRKGRYCLMWSQSYGYLLIWRRRHAYFVLDMNGRKAKNLTATKKEGVAMLLCLKSLDNVSFLISNLSGVDRLDGFILREITVVRLVTPEGRIYVRDSKSRSVEFRIVNKNYAYLKSNLHLSLNPRDVLRNRSSIMVAVAGIVASKIDHPATWNTLMYDRIICYGVKLCRSCWDTCVNLSLPINLDTFPTQLRMGQFVIEVKLLPGVSSAMWRCTQQYKASDFEKTLAEALKQHKHLLFQLNRQMYGVWKKNNFYYLLDPYRHRIIGTKLDEDTDGKYATIRMFRDLDTLVSVFHQVLLESNRSAKFYIHVVKIRQLAQCPKGYALAPLPEGTDVDAVSINETICFPEDYQQCVDELSYDSDYEVEVRSLTNEPFGASFKLAEEEERKAVAKLEEGEEGLGVDDVDDLDGIELNDDDFGFDNDGDGDKINFSSSEYEKINHPHKRHGAQVIKMHQTKYKYSKNNVGADGKTVYYEEADDDDDNDGDNGDGKSSRKMNFSSSAGEKKKHPQKRHDTQVIKVQQKKFKHSKKYVGADGKAVYYDDDDDDNDGDNGEGKSSRKMNFSSSEDEKKNSHKFKHSKKYVAADGTTVYYDDNDGDNGNVKSSRKMNFSSSEDEKKNPHKRHGAQVIKLHKKKYKHSKKYVAADGTTVYYNDEANDDNDDDNGRHGGNVKSSRKMNFSSSEDENKNPHKQHGAQVIKLHKKKYKHSKKYVAADGTTVYYNDEADDDNDDDNGRDDGNVKSSRKMNFSSSERDKKKHPHERHDAQLIKVEETKYKHSKKHVGADGKTVYYDDEADDDNDNDGDNGNGKSSRKKQPNKKSKHTHTEPHHRYKERHHTQSKPKPKPIPPPPPPTPPRTSKTKNRHSKIMDKKAKLQKTREKFMCNERKAKDFVDKIKPVPLYKFKLSKTSGRKITICEPDDVPGIEFLDEKDKNDDETYLSSNQYTTDLERTEFPSQVKIKAKVKACKCDCHNHVEEFKPDSYPGYTENPMNMAVCGSESGTLESLQRLLQSAFKCADRVLTMTPWGNFVVFRETGDFGKRYYIFDGCTCDINRFRHLDLRFGTAGLLQFRRQHDVIAHMIDSRQMRALKGLRTRLNDTSKKYDALKTRGP